MTGQDVRHGGSRERGGADRGEARHHAGFAPAVIDVGDIAWRCGGALRTTRAVPEEVAVALTYNSATHAVMMMTPTDLEDFAVGFSIAEGIVCHREEIRAVEPFVHPLGIDLRITLSDGSTERHWARRRRMAGPVGCGLCGIDSLRMAMRPLPRVTASNRISAEQIRAAVIALSPQQPLNKLTHAMHAAAYWSPCQGIRAVREDVGRHNALDKLCGAMAREDLDMSEGMVLLTSRVSIEMIQKVAIAGCGILVAVSAPTALAVETARSIGLTLVGIARNDGFNVFACPGRIRLT